MSLRTTFVLFSALALVGFVAPGCGLVPDEQKSEGAKTEPSTNADNEGGGKEGQQTDDAADAGTSDYGGGGSNTIYVVNDAVEDVCFLYLAYEGDWSDDVLGNLVLPEGYYYWISGVPDGYIEMYAEGCEGSTWYGAGDVASDYSFILYGGGGGGYDTGDTGDWDTGW